MPNPQVPLIRWRVLVVEDEYFLANDLRIALTSLGAEVMPLAGDLHDAREQIARSGFDIGILDIDLRGDNSFALADELKRREIPFIFSTGYGSELIPARFAGVPRWEKPFDANALACHALQLCRYGMTCQ
ncbi:response regulator [Bradyrhizobium jicamae]|uniref:Response regulator n=1 Tax=Bradyrhizobium jicamae TaxID=280332 RepID=A0ABS5FW39_9BRAD|nr:response regulator [Bradyrhizobium jicamae]MBR0800935.1 response regulator [Bradyrhizobium jicamae]